MNHSPNGGDAQALIARLDWTQSPLGPASQWPQSLRTAVDIVIHSPMPMLLLWGPQLAQIYNDGFALQRGRWWQTESHVPISRVQHLDLKRGPLERAFKLATLVIHTAGTRMAAVSVAGLRGEDAEHLRDRLARQLDHDDDAL